MVPDRIMFGKMIELETHEIDAEAGHPSLTGSKDC